MGFITFLQSSRHVAAQTQEQNPDVCLESYLDTIYLQSHSIYSVKAYRTAITGEQNGFRTFLQKVHNCNEVQLTYKIQEKELDLYRVLNEYVIFLDKNGIKAKTIRLWFSVVKGYLSSLGLEVYSERCRQLVKLPRVIRVKKEALTKEILVKLLRNLDPKLQTAVLVAVSSGMRVGEIAGLKLSDIEFESNPVRVNIRAETTKTREDRQTFITVEASEALKDYLISHFGWNQNSSNEDLKDLRLFGRTNKVRIDKKFDPRLPTKQEQKTEAILLQIALTRKIVKVPELNRLARNGRRIIHFHAFREYFYTATSNASGTNFAHALMGHHNYLDTYYTLPEEQKAELYGKAVPYLTISDFGKLEKDLQKIETTQQNIMEKYTSLERYLRQKDPSFEEFRKRIT